MRTARHRKDQIARTIANESGIAFIARVPLRYQGRISRAGRTRFRELFVALAESALYPFHRLDRFRAPQRGEGKADQYNDEIVTDCFLMDGVKQDERHVFVLAATKLIQTWSTARF